MSAKERRLLGVAFVGVGLAALLACSSSASPSSAAADAGPAEGDERGPCYPNGTCNAALVCRSGLCIAEPDAAPVPPPPPPVADAGFDADAGGDAGPTLSGDVQPILTATCAVVGCHVGTTPSAGLRLDDGKTYAACVGVVSVQDAPLKCVEPGDAETSYLYLKITGRPASGTSPQPPPTTGTVLSTAQKNTIRDWINAGAKND